MTSSSTPEHPFKRKTPLPHTQLVSTDSAYVKYDNATTGVDEMPTADGGFDSTIVVQVYCKTPKETLAYVYACLVLPVHFKIGPRGNVTDTQAYVIMEKDGCAMQPKWMEKLAGYATGQDWKKNIMVRCKADEPGISGSLMFKQWITHFLNQTPAERTEEHTYREAVRRLRHDAAANGVCQNAFAAKAFEKTMDSVVCRRLGSVSSRAVFVNICTRFTDAASAEAGGVLGLEEDPQECECFDQVMGPVKDYLAENNMCFANSEDTDDAEGAAYAMLRVYLNDADNLWPGAIAAGLSDSMEQADTDNKTTLAKTLDSLLQEKSAALTAAMNLVVRETHARMFNVAMERLESLIRPIVPLTVVAAPTDLVRSPRQRTDTAQEDEPQAKHARLTPSPTPSPTPSAKPSVIGSLLGPIIGSLLG
jgi:hypothetical protein